MIEVAAKPRSFGERMDDFVSALSPRWGMRRRMARKAADALARFSSYKGASKNRLRSEWAASSGSADADLLLELPDLRERSRDLNRNDGVAAGITSTVVTNEIGTGIRPQSWLDREVLKLDEEAALALQRQAESVFRRWSCYADAGNRLDFVEIQQLADRQILENGEFILLRQMVDAPDRPYRTCWQCLEPDRLATPPGMGGDKTIRSGVKIGARGEPLGYWIRRTHPGDAVLARAADATQFDYFTARDEEGRPTVLHLYHVLRPGQTRGVPFFSPVLALFKDLADYLEAEVVAARVAACFSLFIKTQDPYGRAQANAGENNSANQRVESLEPGMIEYLGLDEEVTSANPGRPSSNFAPFVERILRSIGSALGLPYELIAKDFSKTNYSSARAALLEARRYFRMRQEWMSRKLCQPIWELVLEEGFLRSEIAFPDFYANRMACVRSRWIPPGWQWVDPTKEVEASRQAVTGMISTLAEENAAQGRDWEETMEQRAREESRRKELGLPAIDEKAVAPMAADVGVAVDGENN